MDELPQEYIKGLDNVVVTYDDEPTDSQRAKMKLRQDQSLFGLYEGIPLTQRGAGYNLVLPDKITIFKYPMLNYAEDEASLFRQVKHTLWHEIAHYYGLNHDRIHEIEDRWQ
jgi:predicted Zn-dependent protease with MMP-like domain